MPPTDDSTLIQAADDFYHALVKYYLEPSDQSLTELMAVAKHYQLLGCKIQLVKEGQCVIVSRIKEVECRPSL